MRAILIANLLAASLAILGVSGCTVWGAQNQTVLKNATGAEQYERIFWAKARDRKWGDIAPLLAANVVYAVDGKALSRDEIVPYLESKRIRDFVIGRMVVKPNAPNMTLSYSLQLSEPGGSVRSLAVVSVWQQMKSGWILIAHAELPQSGEPAQ